MRLITADHVCRVTVPGGIGHGQPGKLGFAKRLLDLLLRMCITTHLPTLAALLTMSTSPRLQSDGVTLEPYFRGDPTTCEETTMKDATAFGESARTLLATLSKCDTSEDDETGMVCFGLSMSPEEAGPVIRALFRAEAELLLIDAETFDPMGPTRTPEQRRADALVEIGTAAAAALEAA